jgi:predicted nucleotidyltransferase
MMSNKLPAEANLAILSLVANEIGALRETLVFVGGCATGLLVTNVRAQPIRATIDVDLVAHVASLAEYHDLEAQFRTLGFTQDVSCDVICRWRKEDTTVDLMPTREDILNFSNRWYVLAVETANIFVLPGGVEIKLISAPAFIGTKLEAFKGRGNNDFLASHDMEDIVTVIDGRETLLTEVKQCNDELRRYLAEEFCALINNLHFIDSLSGHFSGDAASQQRVPRLRKRLRELAKTDRQ